MLNIIRHTSTVHTTARKGRKIQYIVIHYTAGISSKAGSARNTASFFAIPTSKGGRDASADYIVDDMEIVQYNPDIENRMTWHCGGKRQGSTGGQFYNICTNVNSIGVEICSNNKKGKMTNAGDGNWYYTDASLKNALALVKELMKTFNIPARNVITHWNVTGKLCPSVTGWYGSNLTAWNAFKSSISNENNAGDKSSSDDKKSATNNGYKVRVTVNDLKVRKQPNAKADIVTAVNAGEVFTIIGIDGKWLQLKSGAGWIHSAYTEVI